MLNSLFSKLLSVRGQTKKEGKRKKKGGNVRQPQERKWKDGRFIRGREREGEREGGEGGTRREEMNGEIEDGMELFWLDQVRC